MPKYCCFPHACVLTLQRLCDLAELIDDDNDQAHEMLKQIGDDLCELVEEQTPAEH